MGDNIILVRKNNDKSGSFQGNPMYFQSDLTLESAKNIQEAENIPGELLNDSDKPGVCRIYSLSSLAAFRPQIDSTSSCGSPVFSEFLKISCRL